MQPETIPPAPVTTPQRDQQIADLFSASKWLVPGSVKDAFPGTIYLDVDLIETGMRKRSSTYEGPLDYESFSSWLVATAVHEAARYDLVQRLQASRAKILRVIDRNNGGPSQERAIEAEDIFADVAVWVFNHAHEFKVAGTAHLSTRFCALAKIITLRRKRDRNRRLELVSLYQDAIPELGTTIAWYPDDIAGERYSDPFTSYAQ